MKYISILLFIVLSFGDIIYLKNGVKIEGEIMSITADSIAIKTSVGTLDIVAQEIDKIETSTPEKPMPKEVSIAAIPKSIRQVGYGCLGAVITGTAAGMLTALADGFHDYKVSVVVIGSSIIMGVIWGVNFGGK